MSAGPEAGRGDAHGPGGVVFWVSTAVGAAIVVVALRAWWLASSGRSRASLVRFLAGAGLVHDVLWAPLVVVVLLVTARALPPHLRFPVRVGLAVSAVVLLIGWAPYRGYGKRASNPSLLPLDYGRNLAVVLAVIWSVVAMVGIRSWFGERRRQRRER